ncbi:DUF1501 domain-containing protein [Puniceicoccales bacterium CK1056]|uniref:DUF1501 domain-containing protein n=1 Tax=Oceanipulchritudo coccoides TaxID=2706888 RepID=A0A6B2M1K4_9BACT|nr:DUF1501 domain-containing protein [Oceanipulchritudo coccoides]NDV62014.1 DUF1501 domain-containing protein [Oceanipulchritudo coccoides]
MKTPRKISRRKFLVEANCAAVGSISLFSSLFTLKLTAGAVSGGPLPGYKALVCLFLSGGNDSFNMLVPRQQEAYDAYAAVRSTLALEQNSLLPISTTGQAYTEFGLHPALTELQALYNAGHAAFVSNVGTLVEPLTIQQYLSGVASLPTGLFSHSDEQLHWQTVVPQVAGSGPRGWAGRMADCLSQANSSGSIAMNVSLSGTNVMQSGNQSVPYITDPAGAVQLAEYAVDPASQMAIDSVLSQEYRNLYQKTLSSNLRGSIDTAMLFEEATNAVQLTEAFPDTGTGKRLASIARILAARSPLGMNRQVFFLRLGGWDHHKEVLVKQEGLFAQVDAAIGAFWRELGHLGLQDDVALFTASDFGRTLTSNGLGSDHAWGGNHFVIGGGINGGKIYGDYPVVARNAPLDVGRGRLLPTTSIDAYMAELASWFGVAPAELSTVFPNAGNFFDPLGNPFPMGMFQT